MNLHGTEAGLCNVKRQFQDECGIETGKSLTEENLISWRLTKQLNSQGINARSEYSYPGTRHRCDIVINSVIEKSVWIEVKLAWKSWLNCKGRTTGRSPNFKGYLFGDASHPGTAHDFHKLETLERHGACRLGLLLIGFDSLKSRMDQDIIRLAEQERLKDRLWNLLHQDTWLDRRDNQFRIHCWFWSRETC